MELVISAMESEESPTILFGFHDDTFSQCIYMRVDEDPIAVLKYANDLSDGFVKACGEAVRKYREAKHAKEAGSEVASTGDVEGALGEEG